MYMYMYVILMYAYTLYIVHGLYVSAETGTAYSNSRVKVSSSGRGCKSARLRDRQVMKRVEEEQEGGGEKMCEETREDVNTRGGGEGDGGGGESLSNGCELHKEEES